MSGDIQISKLPAATALTGLEIVPVVQNGQTVRATMAQLAGSPTSSANITGGTIDGTPIGNTTPSTGKFTTLVGTGGTLDGNTIGGVTPAAVTGTTVTANTQFSGPGTGLTGTAAGLTAGHVTTNASLTGPITSVGNATAVAAQTGTGTMFAMQTNPSFVGPAMDSINSGFLYGNRVINGAQEIDQLNVGASVTPAGTGFQYLVDMFGAYQSVGSKLTYQQVADAPAGLKNSMKIMVAAQYSPGATDQFFYQTAIEGKDVIDFQMGLAGAATFTWSEWIKGSIAGNYAGSVTNLANNRSYVALIAVTSSYTQPKITLVGDVTGTWPTDNTAGLILRIDLGSGSNFNTTAGSWQAGNFTRTSGSVTFVNQVNGSTLNITGVDCRLGSVAPTVFERRANELQLCQRYLPVIRCTGSSGFEPISMAANFSGANGYSSISFSIVRSKITGVQVSAVTKFALRDIILGFATTTNVVYSTGGIGITEVVYTATVTTNLPAVFGFAAAATSADYIAFTGARLF
jgi:hypothetical protein